MKIRLIHECRAASFGTMAESELEFVGVDEDGTFPRLESGHWAWS